MTSKEAADSSVVGPPVSSPLFVAVVLTEPFAGIMPMSVVARRFGWPVVATYFCEIDRDSCLVASTVCPEASTLWDVTAVSESRLRQLLDAHPGALILIGAGPPCVDVTLLKVDRHGAKGQEAILRLEYAWIYAYLVSLGPTSVSGILECTRMQRADRLEFDAIHACPPVELWSRHFSHFTRPRWWWLSRAPVWPHGTTASPLAFDPEVLEIHPAVERASLRSCLEPSWTPCAVADGKLLASFNLCVLLGRGLVAGLCSNLRAWSRVMQVLWSAGLWRLGGKHPIRFPGTVMCSQ